jgi:hypothetical protein
LELEDVGESATHLRHLKPLAPSLTSLVLTAHGLATQPQFGSAMDAVIMRGIKGESGGEEGAVRSTCSLAADDDMHGPSSAMVTHQARS